MADATMVDECFGDRPLNMPLSLSSPTSSPSPKVVTTGCVETPWLKHRLQSVSTPSLVNSNNNKNTSTQKETKRAHRNTTPKSSYRTQTHRHTQTTAFSWMSNAVAVRRAALRLSLAHKLLEYNDDEQTTTATTTTTTTAPFEQTNEETLVP